MTERVLVTGAGGFIGYHLTKKLVGLGYRVRGVDLKEPRYEPTHAQEFETLDLRLRENCLKATEGIDHVYTLAADMGGIGYITAKLAEIAHNNSQINGNMLEASRLNGVSRFFFSSSACVYPTYRQLAPDAAALKEEDAHPADPMEGYGWEKLFMEKLCEYYYKDHGFETRIARFHTTYGPLETYEGGREKAPAAICRKVALASDGEEIEVWGDGQQTRTFTFVEDTVEGIYRIMQSDWRSPLNVGTDFNVTVDQMVDLVADIAGKTIRKRHDPSKPQGVRGRNSDNTRVREVLGWEPSITLRDGLTATYRWIEEQLRQAGRLPASVTAR